MRHNDDEFKSQLWAFVTTNAAKSLISSALRVAISAIVCEFHFFLP